MAHKRENRDIAEKISYEYLRIQSIQIILSSVTTCPEGSKNTLYLAYKYSGENALKHAFMQNDPPFA